MEHSIRVNVDEIVEIFGVLTGNDVARAIGVGEGIQECLQTTLKQLHKWVFRLVFATTAEDRVFQDVRYTGGIRWRGAEGDSKTFVVIIGSNGEEFGTTLLVSVEGTVGSKLIDHIGGDDFKSRMSYSKCLLKIRRHYSRLTKSRDGSTRARRGSSGGSSETVLVHKGHGSSCITRCGDGGNGASSVGGKGCGEGASAVTGGGCGGDVCQEHDFGKSPV